MRMGMIMMQQRVSTGSNPGDQTRENTMRDVARPAQGRSDKWRPFIAGLIGALALLAPLVNTPPVLALDPEALYTFQAPLVIDNTDKGDAFHCFNRPRQARHLIWNGHEYLVVNASVDILLYEPQTAQLLALGHFGLGFGCGGVLSSPTEVTQEVNAPSQTEGYLDGIDNVTVCDECRWGVLNGNPGAVLFDFGDPAAGGSPGISNPNVIDDTLTGGTYRVGNQQYILLSDGGLSTSPYYQKCPNGEMGVYTVSSSGGVGTNPLTCIDDTRFLPTAGQEVWVPFGASQVPFYIYKQKANHDVYVVRIDTSTGLPVMPPENVTAFSGGNLDYFSIDTSGLTDSQDPHFWLLITNQGTTPSASVYKVTPTATAVGLNFQLLTNQFGNASWDRGGIHYPYVVLTSAGGRYATVGFYDISSNPPALLDDGYWNDPNSSFNVAASDPDAAENSDFCFTNGGTWLYFPRYYQMARFKFTPANPTAVANVTPAPAYWGDTILVDAGSSVGAAEYALWIDDDSTGANTQATVFAGTPVWNNGWGTTKTLNWQIPDDGSSGPYYAHVAVQDVSRGYPYDPATHPEMLANQLVNVDTTPEAKITIDNAEGPFTVFIGDDATLSAANSQGNPSSYSWTVEPPNSEPFNEPTVTVPVTFDQQGTWNISLAVEWANGAYSNSTSTTVEVKSALAAFTYSPMGPKDNEAIQLDASASKPSDQLSYAWQVLDGTDVVWSGSGVTATIPKDTLDPGIYKIRLTVINTSTSESDMAEKTLTVISGASQLLISPSDPEIGQSVSFTVQGITGITGVNWHFGGLSCDGRPADQNCTGQFCTPTVYTYKDPGTHSVRADVVTATGTTSLYGSVTVQSTGSCPASNCTYSSSISKSSFPAGGGNGALTIIPNSSGCAWTASSSQSWLTLSQTSGTGTVTNNYTVASNPGGTRTATITVRGGTSYSRTYNITQSGTGGGGGALVISNTSPKKGETVTFSVQGIDGISGIIWHFGGSSCDGSPADVNCTGQFCTPTAYTYRDAGTKAVSAVVSSASGSQTLTGTVTVQNDGQCSGGTCSYSLSASATNFGPNGGTGTVSVTADAGCAWNATTTEPSWLHITGVGSGNGNGSFNFTVDKYTGSDSRSGQINVRDQSIKITQGGVSKGDFLVSAAASIPGEKGTYWQTDLCMFNPDTGLSAVVHVLFLPESLGPADPVDLTPDGQTLKVKVDNAQQLSSPVIVTSRTYTKQGNGGVGTYGQNVPGQSVSTMAATRLVIGGLHHYQNEDGSGFRTAIGLVNQTDKDVGGIVIHLYDKQGNDVGSYETGLYGNGFQQIDRIVEKVLGNGAQLQDFSVVVRFKDANGMEGAAKEVTAYASMVDDVTGDAVFIQAIPLP